MLLLRIVIAVALSLVSVFADAKGSDGEAVIPPGPNNPVGVAWIDLSKEHYGIHGMPEPSRIGKTQSHGCIRLTNRDVTELSPDGRPGNTGYSRG